jgi:hypothetical protein
MSWMRRREFAPFALVAFPIFIFIVRANSPKYLQCFPNLWTVLCTQGQRKDCDRWVPLAHCQPLLDCS